MRGSTSAAEPLINRNRVGAMPASANASRAARWFSPSTSIETSWPSVAMPPGRYRPDTPAPVPTSTTERALVATASTRNSAPPAGPIGVQPSSYPRSRAAAMSSGSGTNPSAYARLVSFNIASAMAASLTPDQARSAHRIDDQAEIFRRGQRVHDREAGADPVGVTRRRHERDLLIEQAGRPGCVLVIGPADPLEDQYGQVGLDQQAQVVGRLDHRPPFARDGQGALDRVAVGVGAVHGQREPERQAAGAAGQLDREVGRVPLALDGDRVEVAGVLGVRGAG